VGQESVRNAADVLLKTPFLLMSGARGTAYFFATVIAVTVFLVGRDLRKARELRWHVFGLMLVEAAVLAGVLGLVVSFATSELLGALTALSAQKGAASSSLDSMPAATKLMLALGAGLYEEMLFRVILVGGIAAAMRWLIGGELIPGVIAAVAGALIFSAFHYVGQYGDQWQLSSFVYRALAGLAFSALYLTRGFGITAWTHALYDVYVMLL
jgi:hypothetical protein